ncbi:MAG: 6-bladed beta-propeller [Pirellulales bacterium]
MPGRIIVLSPSPLKSALLVAIVAASMPLTPCPANAGYDYVGTITPQDSGPVVGVATDGGSVYLAVDGMAFDNRTIQAFTTGGAFIRKIGAAEAPNDVATGFAGNVYLADGFGGILSEYTASGGHIRTYNLFPSSVALGVPVSITAGGDGDLWATGGNGIVAHFASTGDLIDQFTIPGIAEIPGIGLLAAPSGIAVNPVLGIVFVAMANRFVGAAGGDRILIFAPDGSLLDEFGSTGSGAGQLNLGYASKIALDESFRVFVADSGNHRVQVFDAINGQYITQFGAFGSGNGQLTYPTALTVDAQGKNVWVGDSSGDRVQHFMVPEPSTFMLFGAGALALIELRRRRPWRTRQ